MTRLFAAGFAAVSLILPAAAGAADLAGLPAKAPVYMAPVFDWGGFYVGVNGGGGSRHQCWNFAGAGGAPTGEGCHDATGGTAGGQFGYRWQATNWVFGVETQGNWAGFSGDNVSTLFPAQSNRSRIDAFGLFTGQIGYAWNNALFYVKGGGAVVDDRYDIDIAPGLPGAGTRIANNNHVAAWGGTIGAGLEYGFAPNWSLGFEYDHLFLGDRTVGLTTIPLASTFQTDSIRQDVDIGLVRLNYRFGGPSLASY